MSVLEMEFARRMTRTPRPFDADRGRDASAQFADLPPEIGALLSGAAGCSPYLDGLLTREADWLRGALAAEPEDSVDAILSGISGDLAVELRIAKRRLALIVALSDLAGVWTLPDVTGALTRFADRSVDLAIRDQVGRQIERRRLPAGRDEDGTGGLVALAMGKMGAFELNYSSDIDLILLFDESRFDADSYPMAQSGFTRAARGICQLLSDQTAEGYVFRTDLRLRPDPSVTPVAMAMARAERYYESLGRTWERAAHVKARPCGGDVAAGEAYLGRLAPFVWRRHLDFAAIQDAHDIRLRIRDHRGFAGPVTLEGHDLKLGRGGIREIEFFTQTRQIIAGGRDPSLRVRGTVEGLSRLAEKGWIERDLACRLTKNYGFFREVEHRLQMVADAQTHVLPDDDEGFARLAAMMDRDPADLREELRSRLEEVSQETEDFFSAETTRQSDDPDLTEAQRELVGRWRGLPALRSERALDIFDRIRPMLLQKLLAGPRADQALARFDDFLRGMPAGVQLFSLFEANPQLIDLISDIAGTTPDLAAYLAQNSAVLDSVIGGDFFSDWPGAQALETSLSARLSREGDYEAQLDSARSWMRDWHFRIGVHHLRGLIGPGEAGAQYADLAAAVVRGIWPAVVADFATRHGPPPGAGAALVAMGSLGAGRLNARSDLDLIVVYDEDGVEASEGPRPLASPLYYTRLTQALVTALQAPMARGRLYEVDMRLRPSGRQGPIATSVAAFETYQRNEAWTWEHLALTRLRTIAGPDRICQRVDSVRKDVLEAPRDFSEVVGAVEEMRGRLERARPEVVWDAKAGPGHLQEIELLATMLGLLSSSVQRDPRGQIRDGVRAGLIGAGDAEILCEAHTALGDFNTAARLLGSGPIEVETLGSSGEALILRTVGEKELKSARGRLADHAAQAAEVISQCLVALREGGQDNASGSQE